MRGGYLAWQGSVLKGLEEYGLNIFKAPSGEALLDEGFDFGLLDLDHRTSW